MTCKTCKYWKKFTRDDQEPMGECLRYPPMLDVQMVKELDGMDELVSDKDIYWASPITCEDHWCGEYETRKRV